MKKIMLTCAGETSVLWSEFKKLQTEITEFAEYLQPANPRGGPAQPWRHWAREHSGGADFVVVLYATPEAVASEPGGRPAAGLPEVTKEELLEVAGKAKIIVAALTSTAWNSVKDGGFPHDQCFDLSHEHGRNALKCLLFHEEAAPRRKLLSLPHTAVGGLGLILGALANVFGDLEKIRAGLLSSVGETAAQAIHYFMSCFVVLLLVGSLLLLVRSAMGPVLSYFGTDLSWLRWRERRILIRFAVVVLLAMPVALIARRWLPTYKNIADLVGDQEEKWATRLINSQHNDGGFKEHPTRTLQQAWLSAQAAVGLLSSGRYRTATRLREAFQFFDRTEIGDYCLPEDKAKKLNIGDPRVVSAHYPTLAFALKRLPQGVQMSDLKFSARDEGWGYLEQMSWGVTEVNAWIAVAYAYSLQAENPSFWPPQDEPDAKTRLRGMLVRLAKREIKRSGAYSPIADASEVDYERTYSTVMTLWAFAEALNIKDLWPEPERRGFEERIQRSVTWLSNKALPDGWKVNPSNPAKEVFAGLTAQTLATLGRVPAEVVDTSKFAALQRIKRSFLAEEQKLIHRPIRQNDRMHDADRYLFPSPLSIEGSTFLWFPWAVGVAGTLADDPSLDKADREKAGRLRKKLEARAVEFTAAIEEASEFNYVPSEGLIGFSWRRKAGKS